MAWAFRLPLSPDGKEVAYVAFSNDMSVPNRLKVVPAEGGAVLYELDWPVFAAEPHWSPSGKAVQYVRTQESVSNIWEQNLSGGPPKQITNFTSGLIFGFDWSPDGKQLALTRGSVSSDVVMISNFR